MQQDLQKLFVNQYNWLRLSQDSPKFVQRARMISLQHSKRGHIMRASIRSSTVSRLAGAVAALWLCGAGAAWAGGGADLASINQLFTGSSGLCAILKLTTCYQLPTITQGMLEVAALSNSPPEMVAAQNSITPGYNVIAGNPATGPFATNNFLPISFPLPAASTTTTTVSELLSTLTPIGFAPQSSGTAVAKQLNDPNAVVFLYAVGVSSFQAIGVGGLTNPDTVYFFYDDTSRTNANLKQGQIVAKFLLPTTQLNSDGSEIPVPITLQYRPNNGGDCSTSTVSGIGTQTLMAAQVGIDCAVVFSASPTSTQKHAIFEVAVKLLVTGQFPTKYSPFTAPLNTDPPYFYSNITTQPGNVSAGDSTAPPLTGNFSIYTAFGFGPEDVLGAPLPSGILPAPAYSIGLAPTAGPLCTVPNSGGTATCPASTNFTTPTFALCANLPVGNGNGQAPVPAVAAFYAIATDGETWLGAPPAPMITIACPAL
jgi:hypothetical protein